MTAVNEAESMEQVTHTNPIFFLFSCHRKVIVVTIADPLLGQQRWKRVSWTGTRRTYLGGRGVDMSGMAREVLVWGKCRGGVDISTHHILEIGRVVMHNAKVFMERAFRSLYMHIHAHLS